MNRNEFADYVKENHAPNSQFDIWVISVVPTESSSISRPLNRAMKPVLYRVTAQEWSFIVMKPGRDGQFSRVEPWELQFFLTEEEAWQGFEWSLAAAHRKLMNENMKYVEAVRNAFNKAEQHVLKYKNKQ